MGRVQLPHEVDQDLVENYRLMNAILASNAAAFDKHLLARCRMRQDVFGGDPADDEPSIVDWTALALVCFARKRGLEVRLGTSTCRSPSSRPPEHVRRRRIV